MRFKVDENLPEELCQLFGGAGWDCKTVADQGMSGALDPHVTEVCQAEDRILVSFDRGFANVTAYPPSSFPGMIVFRLGSQAKQHVLSVATRLIEELTKRELRHELWIVEEFRIRIRRF